VGEGLVTGALGAVLGWFAGAWIHPFAGAVMALVGGVNGLVSGWRRIYPWRRLDGALAFVADSTWAAFPVMVGLVAHVVALARKAEYLAVFSERQGQHVYRGGMVLKTGYAFTVGNVISGAGAVEQESRARLVDDHESVHVWQARLFGPFYLPLYVLWAACAALVGLVLWVRRGRKERVGAVVQSCAYYMNPFEWWAYSRQAYWPPSGLVQGIGWKKPAVKSYAELRGERPDRR
jgi:hypothetical protein